MFNNLHSFYTSREWQCVRNNLMLKRGMMCDHCHQLIHNKYDAIGHHKIELNMSNINNPSISLNLDNLMLVHHACHNEIHKRFGTTIKGHRFLVYGSPLSGKTTYVSKLATKDDLVLNLDKIRLAITGGVPYENSNYTLNDVFAVRDLLLDRVRTNATKANNVYIIGGYPLVSEREWLCRELDLEPVFIECSKEECLLRLEADKERDSRLWKNYIERWFNDYVE